MAGYGQFCPVAKAMEILDERWTLLVVRELLMGSRHFNDIRRGVPRMSPALLSKRLRSLERYGVVARTGTGQRTQYALTTAGRELSDVVNSLGQWGVRWIADLGAADLDPHLLLWDLKRTISVDRWPPTRTVLAFAFDDLPDPGSHWWLVVTGDDAEACDFDPGYPVSATVRCDLRTMTRVWRGDLSWDRALRSGQVRVEGATAVRRAVPGWIGVSPLAGVPRPVQSAAQLPGSAS